VWKLPQLFTSTGGLSRVGGRGEDLNRANRHPSKPYSQVVDNATEGRFQAPGSRKESSNPDGYGKDYTVAKPSESTKPARLEVNIPADDYYAVYAW
jgi:hypothetical protein